MNKEREKEKIVGASRNKASKLHKSGKMFGINSVNKKQHITATSYLQLDKFCCDLVNKVEIMITYMFWLYNITALYHDIVFKTFHQLSIKIKFSAQGSLNNQWGSLVLCSNPRCSCTRQALCLLLVPHAFSPGARISAHSFQHLALSSMLELRVFQVLSIKCVNYAPSSSIRKQLIFCS